VPRVSEPPFHRRLSRLVPLDTALSGLAPRLSPVEPMIVPVREALGRVLAVPLVAPGAVPSAAIALQDGFAVSAADVQGASPFAPVLVPSASAVEAGCPLPPGADAVIAAHLVPSARGGRDAVGEVFPGEGTLSAGDDLLAGAVIRAAGELLRPVDLVAAVAAGVGEIAVRSPRVAVLVTGAEISVDRDALGPMLAAAMEKAGAAPVAVSLLPDDEQSIAAAMREADADLVLVTGGTGLGGSDRSVAALEEAGTPLVHGIAIRPGTTAALGHVGTVPVILLPGRPAECFGALLVLALPTLRRRAGMAEPAGRRLRLSRKIASQAGFAEITLLRRESGSAEPLATGALPLSAIAAADGYAVIAAGSEGFDAGAEVAVLDI
jgi:molybdenum cofactor synthesis domain-containing protein